MAASIRERFDHLFLNNSNVTVKDTRFIVKTITETGQATFVVPSRLFPLEDIQRAGVFVCENTQNASEDILEPFDKVHYNVGHCYQNAEMLEAVLKARGYNAQMYSGWVFLGYDGPPIHHSWVIVDDMLLDLSNDRTLLYNSKYVNLMQGKSKDAARKVFTEYMSWAMKLPNHIRCEGAGKVRPDELYIGCPSTLAKSAFLVNRLYDEFPGHPSLAKGTDINGYSPMQQLLKKKGVI